MIDLSHIMMCEITRQIGPSFVDEVVLFNAKRISEKEALACVEAGEYNKNVLVLLKSQWISLFKDGRED